MTKHYLLTVSGRVLFRRALLRKLYEEQISIANIIEMTSPGGVCNIRGV